MARIEIERIEADGLSRQVWHFHLTTGFGSLPNFLRVEYYGKEARPSRRHKWVVLAANRYTAFDPGSYNSGVPAKDVPLPDDVAAEAKDILMKSVQVVGPHIRESR